MGQLGFPELIIIAVIALLIFGPKKLPELGSSLGRTIRDFKSAMSDSHSDSHEQNAPPQEKPAEEPSHAPPDGAANVKK